ncbi:hypothetical protein M902_0744 [Bacteriovorax sp. BAL6_X]|uniref:hypothetical protein n=1 Tax=Bacteriovorax sp. BAL6_X TaxID=1201290 RepID=UPI00038647DA|nr:hypothetical protein [Bacteriovorax sp. BAL6_X]EPZ49514.1 hypothetical protein M902_0744 [Bacteriovorax sp. BAL6_X]
MKKTMMILLSGLILSLNTFATVEAKNSRLDKIVTQLEVFIGNDSELMAEPEIGLIYEESLENLDDRKIILSNILELDEKFEVTMDEDTANKLAIFSALLHEVMLATRP